MTILNGPPIKSKNKILDAWLTFLRINLCATFVEYLMVFKIIHDQNHLTHSIFDRGSCDKSWLNVGPLRKYKFKKFLDGKPEKKVKDKSHSQKVVRHHGISVHTSPRPRVLKKKTWKPPILTYLWILLYSTLSPAVIALHCIV